MPLPKKPKYLRFEAPAAGQTEGVTNGIFRAAYELRVTTDLPGWKVDAITELIDWFKQNLEIPKRFTSSRSKGYHRRNTRGISWFKPTATEHLNRIRMLQELLRDESIVVVVRTTDSPGYVVYEDEFQIVAEPFSSNK
jgi:hypothetical protein